jgi:flagellar hook-associated protein 2
MWPATGRVDQPAMSSTPATASTVQVTGLASGLDTAQIVTQLMQVQQRPVLALQNHQHALTARNTQLSVIQGALRTVGDDAMALLDPGVFRRTQQTTSSDLTRVAASPGSGAGVGAYEVAVSRLAGSAQRTFAFSSPTGADTITIDGHEIDLPAGASAADLVKAINNAADAPVYAAATDAGTVVLSSRQTGDTGADFIQVADGAGSLVEQTGRARAGHDAAYTIDGAAGTSATNTVSGAIPGVTLTLSGVTTVSGPCTINIAAPAADPAKLTTAVNRFVTDYNAAIGAVQSQLAQTTSASDPTRGSLYGDPQLHGLLRAMRGLMFHAGEGLPMGLSTMLDIGVSSGAPTGSAPTAASSLAGDLTVDAARLQSALSADPTGVQKLVGSWANSLAALVNAHAGPGGSIDQRISGDNGQLSQLARRISSMQAALDDKQQQLTRQFAQLESALSSSESRSGWLAGQIAALPGSRTSS